MDLHEKKINDIRTLVNVYFSGLYYGDVGKLEEAFHRECKLIGSVKGQPYKKSLDEYLQIVKNRKSPSQLDEPFAMTLLSLDLLGEIAMAKLRVPMLGFDYVDYLSLLRTDGKWKIVNKLFISEG